MGKALKLPKTECCVSSTRCDRCPIRMLKEGTLPSGYGVHKRKLVRLDATGKKAKKVKKAELAAAVRVQKAKKKSGKKKQFAA
jgi:hypothetical protein